MSRTRSISSVIDYALSINKPIGISSSSMFKNIYTDEICLEKVSIQHCIDNYPSNLENNKKKSRLNGGIFFANLSVIHSGKNYFTSFNF